MDLSIKPVKNSEFSVTHGSLSRNGDTRLFYVLGGVLRCVVLGCLWTLLACTGAQTVANVVGRQLTQLLQESLSLLR